MLQFEAQAPVAGDSAEQISAEVHERRLSHVAGIFRCAPSTIEVGTDNSRQLLWEGPNPIMKKLITSLLAIVSLSATPLLLSSGCSGTTTRESTGEYVDDTAVTAKVKAELIRDPVVKARQVDVTTFKGTVQLSGFVDTDEQKARAGELTRGITGVEDVKNNIVVKAATTP